MSPLDWASSSPLLYGGAGISCRGRRPILLSAFPCSGRRIIAWQTAKQDASYLSNTQQVLTPIERASSFTPPQLVGEGGKRRLRPPRQPQRQRARSSSFGSIGLRMFTLLPLPRRSGSNTNKSDSSGDGVSVLDAPWRVLREVAWDRVDVVAKKMNLMPQELVDKIDRTLRRALKNRGANYFQTTNDLFCLQVMLRWRQKLFFDLTPVTLAMAHDMQLRILATIQTGNKEFMNPEAGMSQRDLAEAVLHHMASCPNTLPVGKCWCKICAEKDEFCNSCMCIYCYNFDSGSDACCWVPCGNCCHWAHTDCAINAGRIRVGHKIKDGTVKILYRCGACGKAYQLLPWIREVFRSRPPVWESRDALLRELGYICRILHTCEDWEDRKFFRICTDLIKSLRSGSAESMCRTMLLQALQEQNYEERRAFYSIIVTKAKKPIEVTYALLENITDGFSQVIGSGGFGVVYTGVLGLEKVAVKKLFQTSHFSGNQFKDELASLRRVKHKNIVRFLGYCFDTQKKPVEHNGRIVLAEDWRRFLCFEYVPNKSLYDFLQEQIYCPYMLSLTDESHGHEWDTRYQIIKGICQGLNYLHNKERITHLDLKPDNILLDRDMVPKITDFGFSRSFSEEQSRIITENIRGSRGYIAPEYWSKGEISFKSDIFSLGVIIRQLICGSKDPSNPENWHQSLDTESPQVKRCIKIAQLCVDDDPRKRPTIDCIIHMLDHQKEDMAKGRLFPFWPLKK
ncbi:hypothetical protein ACP4OV_002367 [Aristida adscensionis]